MTSKADSLLLLIALIVVGGAALAGYFIFATNDAAFIEEQEGLLVQGESTTTGARRSAGPNRQPEVEEQPVVEDAPTEKTVSVAGPAEALLSGTVLGSDGEPLPEASIHCEMNFPVGKLNYGLVSEFEEELKTDEKGTFEIVVPAEAYFDLVVRHDLHAPVMKSSVPSGEKLTIEMQPSAGMWGHVHRHEGGTIVGATLHFRVQDSSWEATAKTDAAGRYGVAGLPPGKVLVSVEAPDCLGVEDRLVVLVAQKPHEEDFVLNGGRTIQGTIVDKNGTRIEGAEVKCNETTVVSDIAGRFRIGGLEQDEHDIEVIAGGFLTDSREVNLSGSREVAEIEVELSRGGRVYGTVLDEKSEPVPDAEVKVFESWGGDRYMWEMDETRFVTRTDANGRFEIDGLPTNNWSSHRARARKDGYADAFCKSFKIKDREKPQEILLVLRQGGGISGRVIDDTGSTLEGVKLTLEMNNVSEWSSNSRNARHVLSDAEGRFKFDRLTAGSYRVSARARGHATAYKGNLKVEGAAETEGVELILKEGGAVRGSVKTQQGDPVAGARVRLNSMSSWGYGISDEEGNYVIENVGEGPYWMRCRAEGYSHERKNRVFPEDGKIDFELRLDGYVWGQVVASDTKTPIREFTIELKIQDSTGGRTRWRRKSSRYFSDVEGRFKIYAPNGTYRLVLNAQGYVEKEIDNVAIDVDAEPEEMTVEMTSGGAIEGWVRDENGEPISWCEVFVRKEGEESFQTADPTEQDGYYYVDSLESGAYEVVFQRRGLIPLTTYERIYVVGGDIRRLDHQVRDQTLLVIRYADVAEDQKVPRYMRVIIRAADGSPVGMRRTGWGQRRGKAQPYTSLHRGIRPGHALQVRELPPGRYLLSVSANGFEGLEKTIDIGPDEEVLLPMLLEPKGKKKKKRGNSP